MEFLVIGLAIVATFVVIAMHRDGGDCPRSILGYICRGEGCDHSKIEVARAKRAKRKGDRWL